MNLATTMCFAQSLPAGLPLPSQTPRVNVSGTVNTSSSSSGANGSATHYGSASSYQTAAPSAKDAYTSDLGQPYQQSAVSAYAGEISGSTTSNVSGMVTGVGVGAAIAHGIQSGSVVVGTIQPLSIRYDNSGNPLSEERVVGDATGIVSVKVDGDSATAVVGNGSASVQGSALGSGYTYSYVSAWQPIVDGSAYINHNADVTNVVITGNGNVDGSHSTVNAQSYYNAQYEGSPGTTDHLKSLP